MKPVILLVEDDENDAFLIERAFAKTNSAARFNIASDGREALRYLLGEDQYADREKYPLPDLILLDLNLPRVPGLEVLRALRAEPNLKRMIVVILSSSPVESDIEQAYDLGANSYLTKPNALEGFQELAEDVCRYWLKRNKKPLASVAQGAV